MGEAGDRNSKYNKVLINEESEKMVFWKILYYAKFSAILEYCKLLKTNYIA